MIRMPYLYAISNERPPIYGRLLQRFGGVEWEHGDEVVAWNGVIYTKHELTRDELVHELCHLQQQHRYPGGHEAYLENYLHSDDFRLAQEVEAYCDQLDEIFSENPRRSDAAWCKEKFARLLCDQEIYDLDISHAQAIRMLSLNDNDV